MQKISESQAIIIAAIIGLIGVLIGGYFVIKAAQEPFRLALEATQTAEARFTVEVIEEIPSDPPEPQATNVPVEKTVSATSELPANTPNPTTSTTNNTPIIPQKGTITPLLSGFPGDWLPNANDIPNEMTRIENRSYSNEEIARLYPDQPDLLSKLEQWGRLNNSFQIYQDIDRCDSKTGLQKIGLQAILYKTSDGASQGINQTKTQWGYQSDSVEIGDKSFILWYDETNDCTPPDNLRTVSILFQRYNVVANVDVGAVKGNLNEDDIKSFAIELAQKIDNILLTEAK